MFFGAVLDGPHAFLDRSVLHCDPVDPGRRVPVALRFAIEQVIVRLVGERNESAWHVFDVNALAVLHCRDFRFRQRALGMIVDAPGPAIFIVDRHPGMRTQGMAGAWRNDRVPGDDPGRYPPIVFVPVGIAPGADQQSAGKLLDLEQGHAVLLVVDVALRTFEQWILVELRSVQPRHVTGIDAAFHRLQIVAFLQTLGDQALRRIHLGPLQRGWRRLHARRAHIRPDDSGLLDARVGFQLDVLAEAAFFRLRGQVNALPGHVVFPPMIRAAQSTLLVLPKPERDAAMRAELVHQADAALAVAETNQVFSHQFHPNRRAIRFGNLRNEQEWRPVAPQQLAHQGIRADAAQLIVLLTRHHGDVSPLTCYYPLNLGRHYRQARRGRKPSHAFAAYRHCNGRPRRHWTRD